VRLEAGPVSAVVLPSLGGRMISLRHGRREFLWHDPELLDADFRRRVPLVPVRSGGPMSTWQNWGGDKSWPAPQTPEGRSGWHGPPDPVLDGGRYRVIEHDGDRRVLLQSEIDDRTGLQQTRSIRITETGVIVGTTITNRSASTVRFAPWEVMQVAVSPEDEQTGTVEVEAPAGSSVRGLGRYWGFPRITEHGNTLRVGFGHAVAKLGFTGATGRVECRFADGAALALQFVTSDEAPESAPFQLWLQTPLDVAPAGLGGWRPAHRLVELEPVGALCDLPPDGSASLSASWCVSVAG
jgi:hypothetical protein